MPTYPVTDQLWASSMGNRKAPDEADGPRLRHIWEQHIGEQSMMRLRGEREAATLRIQTPLICGHVGATRGAANVQLTCIFMCTFCVCVRSATSAENWKAAHASWLMCHGVMLTSHACSSWHMAVEISH